MLVATQAQGNDQCEAKLTSSEQMLAETLHNLLVAIKVINPDVPVDPVQLIMAGTEYTDHLNQKEKERQDYRPLRRPKFVADGRGLI